MKTIQRPAVAFILKFCFKNCLNSWDWRRFTTASATRTFHFVIDKDTNASHLQNDAVGVWKSVSSRQPARHSLRYQLFHFDRTRRINVRMICERLAESQSLTCSVDLREHLKSGPKQLVNLPKAPEDAKVESSPESSSSDDSSDSSDSGLQLSLAFDHNRLSIGFPITIRN